MDLFIDIENPGRYYALFYFLAFLTGLILLVKEGQRRKFPIVPWLLVITTAFLFFMAGSQAIKFSLADWLQVFRFEKLDRLPGRSVLGGILLVVPALIMAKYALRFQHSMIDAFAFVTPIGMLIQRTGCLLAGCCYGRVTEVPWGIKYGAMSHAFQQHTHENLISLSANSSLPVHPAQLYDMIGCLLILIVLALVKKYIRVPCNLFLTTILLYGHVRFLTEFFRVPTSGNLNIIGLTVVQVCLLLLIPLLLSTILIRERGIQKVGGANEKIPSPPGPRYMFYFVFIIFLFLLFSRWLSPLEVVTLNLVLLPTLAFIGWQIFKSVTVPKMRWATGMLLAGSLVIMSQTLPESSKSDSTRISYNIFSIGTLTGNSKFVHKNFDCSGSLPDSHLNNFYKANAVGISRVVQERKNRIVQYGIDGFMGRHREEVDGVKVNDIALIGIHPYFQYDAKIVGFGLGFHAGRLSKLTNLDFDGTNQPRSARTMGFYPSLYFRIGYINRFFGEIKVAQQFPTSFPSLGFQTNLGIGFGKNNGGAFRIGTASFAGLFLAPSFPAGKNLIIEPYLGFFNGLRSSGFGGLYDAETNFTGALSLRYKFNFKER